MTAAKLNDDRKGERVPATLFDVLDRDDIRQARFNEPTFRFPNRRVGAKWQRVRDLLDEWFGLVPSDARVGGGGRSAG
jgi:hypothetical protein